jgi:non-specific serine/threonine protein kinase
VAVAALVASDGAPHDGQKRAPPGTGAEQAGQSAIGGLSHGQRDPGLRDCSRIWHSVFFCAGCGLPEPGKTLLHYRLIEKIGEGGMGEIWHAEDVRLERPVALKLLPEHASHSEQAVERFRREARAASALNHPHICTIHDIGEAEGRQFIVMELLDGQSLQQRLQTGPLGIDETIELAAQLADALAAAHAAGILHRDIKPANIFIGAQGRAKVLDFGLAKLATPDASAGPADSTVVHTPDASLTNPGTTVGTVAYMSPEQALGQELDARSDLFSLGAVLYEMATGKPAFAGATQAATFDAILNRAPRPLADLNPGAPSELARTVDKALAKDRTRRYQSASELAADLQRSRSAPAVRARPVFSRRWLGALLAVAALAALAVFLPGLLESDPPTGGSERPARIMLAVLPFDNLGGDPAQEYFSDGITEDLIAELGRVRADRLGVIARTSAMHFKGTSATIGTIGRELGVEYVVEGSVQRAGDQVRITAKLIAVADQSQLWSASFDRQLEEVLSLQAEVAREVTRALAVELLPESGDAEIPSTDPRAYEAYVSGRYWFHNASGDEFSKALEYYEQAVEIDPGYARAWAGIAEAYAGWSTWHTRNPAEYRRKAIEAATKAVELDENLADSRMALALIRLIFEWRWDDAGAELERAIVLDPGFASAHHWYGHYLGARGNHAAAVQSFERALRVDPLSPHHLSCMTGHLIAERRYDDAQRALDKTVEVSPGYTMQRLYLGWLRERQGRLDEAIAAWEAAAAMETADPAYMASLAYGYGRAGRTTEARELLARLEPLTGGGNVAMLIAKVHAGLGELDETFAWLDRAFENQDGWLWGIDIDPGFDPLRNDPRYAALQRRLGLVP